MGGRDNLGTAATFWILLRSGNVGVGRRLQRTGVQMLMIAVTLMIAQQRAADVKIPTDHFHDCKRPTQQIGAY